AGETPDTGREQVRRDAGAGADLEHVRSQLDAFQYPGQNVSLDGLPPAFGTAQPAVHEVHGGDPRVDLCPQSNRGYGPGYGLTCWSAVQSLLKVTFGSKPGESLRMYSPELLTQAWPYWLSSSM